MKKALWRPAAVRNPGPFFVSFVGSYPPQRTRTGLATLPNTSPGVTSFLSYPVDGPRQSPRTPGLDDLSWAAPGRDFKRRCHYEATHFTKKVPAIGGTRRPRTLTSFGSEVRRPRTSKATGRAVVIVARLS